MTVIKEIGLRELIAAVKRELKNAAADARDDDSGMFLLQEFQLEVAVAVEKDGKGEISIKVLDFGGSIGGGVKRTEANTISLKFVPTEDWIDEAYSAEEEDADAPTEPESASRARRKGSA